MARARSSPRAGEGRDEGASPLGAEMRHCLKRRGNSLRCSELRRGPLTLASLRSLDLSPHAGRGESKAILFSRRVLRASDVKQRRLLSRHLRRERSEPRRTRPGRLGHTLRGPLRGHLRVTDQAPWNLQQFFSISRERKKRREAERRQTRYSTARTQAAHRARHGHGGLRRPSAYGRARLPAFHHGTCGGDRTPPLSSSSRASWNGTS